MNEASSECLLFTTQAVTHPSSICCENREARVEEKVDPNDDWQQQACDTHRTRVKFTSCLEYQVVGVTSSSRVYDPAVFWSTQ